MFLVEIPIVDEDYKGINEDSKLEGEPIGFEMLETDPCISLPIVNGIQSYQIMRIIGHYGRKPIQILLDSGSTNKFLDVELAKKLGCRLEPISLQPMLDGSELAC